LAWAQTSAGKSDDAAATIHEAQKQHPEQEKRLADVLVKMRQAAKNQPAAQTSELPPNHPPIGATGAASPEAVHVTLALAAGMAPPQQGIIYVIARAAGVSAGPPAAVQRMALSTFPLTSDMPSPVPVCARSILSAKHPYVGNRACRNAVSARLKNRSTVGAMSGALISAASRISSASEYARMTNCSRR